MIVELGKNSHLTLDDLVAVARHSSPVIFSENYINRVQASRKLVEKWSEEERVMYGITTGFGVLCTEAISKEDTVELQRNIVLTHATSVGEPMPEEEVRAIMLMILQNTGLGYSGVRLETLELIRQCLNLGLTPFVPRDGSVGYLSVEGHIAVSLIGEEKIKFQGEWLDARVALEQAGLQPLILATKEGLALLNGATSPTALAALSLYDMLRAVKSADIIASMSLEVLKGTLRAFDEKVMNLKRHTQQSETAANIRKILADSNIAQSHIDHRLQDALSLRAIAQLHGAVKKTLADAKLTIENEMNSCSDNPVIMPDGDDGYAMSSCNCDAAYVGLEIDSASIATTMLAKMSERRNVRLIDGNLSGYPWFLVKKPGLNSGLMIPQYTQAGLLNEMKMLSMPAVVDNISTCGGQEDYVSMGYNAAKKAASIVSKLEYILAIELLSVYQAHQFMEKEYTAGSATQVVLNEIQKTVPVMDNDMYLYPHIMTIKDLIHHGVILDAVEAKIGKLA
ncbi:histidine ammonia-lyase [Acinetobacter sp. ANC 4558]|uniref:HAL/PAL/TAL family ammonia-lyase n=1 Tax=Acinetobacter sp. ANC 4558 TaxID=1977876 RepID=UPI000A33436E|nr:aromatic amino acid ammonia-lyase [Acinetobacter sp. ANC 4558]OTG85578.1 histidine ammonia-lyase [Acinetobacter sp. ANC 4558]